MLSSPGGRHPEGATIDVTVNTTGVARLRFFDGALHEEYADKNGSLLPLARPILVATYIWNAELYAIYCSCTEMGALRV